MRFIVFDVETPNRSNDRISAIGITVIDREHIKDQFYSLVDPETTFDPFNTELTGISAETVRGKPTFPELWKRIEPVMNSGTLVAHNAVFDLSVLRACLVGYGILWKRSVPYLCTVQMGRKLLPDMGHKLNELSDHYGIELEHHRADSDSHACANILLRFLWSGVNPREYIKTFDMTAGFKSGRPGASGRKTAAGLKRGDVAYILESNWIVREVLVLSVSGGFCTLRFLDGHGGGVRLRESRVFRTKEEARRSAGK